MTLMKSLVVGVTLVFTSLVTADYQVIELQASSSASLNATGCCSMSYMGSSNPSSLSMKNCQSVYMSCVTSKRAAVWQFDLTQIPDDATLISARFKGTRPYSDMQGSGFLAMAFDTGPLNSSVCMSLWNGGDWQTSLNWPYGTDFSLTITSGLNVQFDQASTMSLMGYAGTTSQVTVVNSGNERPVLALTIEVPDAAPCDGDINDDQVVDGSDVSMILGYWGHDDPAYDLDGSGLVDGADLAVILGWWGVCPE